MTSVRNLKSGYWRPWLSKPEHRCLVPVTSFCEYPDEPPKIPHWFALTSESEARPLFAFAGIWRQWTGERKKEQGEHTLFAFLTTEPNDVVRPIHSKAMPVIVRPEDYETWLVGETEDALALAVPYAAGEMAMVASGEKQDAA